MSDVLEPRAPAGSPRPELLRGLLVLRVVIVSTLLLSALLIQLTFSLALPLSPVYYLAALAYGLSIGALLGLTRLSPTANAILQILGDLGIVTGLVYISRGPESGFTFLYLAVVTSGTLLLGRRGGLVTAGLASVFYAVLVHLMSTGAVPAVESDELAPRVWSAGQLVGNVAMNAGAFAATALLVSAASEKLRRAEADVERRKTEIARLQALHSSVLASMSSGVLTTDLDGVVTFANPPAFDLLLKGRDELVGQHLSKTGLVDPESIARIAALESDALRFEGNRTALGPDAYFGVTATPLRDEHGRVTGRILIFQNLTELKKLESEVRLKEKLAAVGELTAAIAHEIRNPLASISGSVQVLSSSAAPGSAERRLMDVVVQESHRLSSILEDFLKYVRPREQAIEAVDGAAALRDVLSLLAHSDELGAGHAVSWDLEPESVVLQADPGQLRQVFWNLSRNAVAAMPGEGRLSVEARLEGPWWIVTMRDEGRGMTPEERDRLFAPFAHSFPGGTGLGLAIVHRIVEEHGGSIRVESAPGRGTAVVVSLPLDGPRGRSAVREPAAEPSSRARAGTEAA